MLPECIPQTGQVLPNYPDRRLRHIRIITRQITRVSIKIHIMRILFGTDCV